MPYFVVCPFLCVFRLALLSSLVTSSCVNSAAKPFSQVAIVSLPEKVFALILS